MYPAQPDKGAYILLNKPLGLVSITYDSEPDDGHYTISLGHRPSTIVA